MFKYRRTRCRVSSFVPMYILDVIGRKRKTRMLVSNRRIGRGFAGRQNYTSTATEKSIIDGTTINRLTPKQFRNFYEHLKHASNNRSGWIQGEGARLVSQLKL